MFLAFTNYVSMVNSFIRYIGKVAIRQCNSLNTNPKTKFLCNPRFSKNTSILDTTDITKFRES